MFSSSSNFTMPVQVYLMYIYIYDSKSIYFVFSHSETQCLVYLPTGGVYVGKDTSPPLSV